MVDPVVASTTENISGNVLENFKALIDISVNDIFLIGVLLIALGFLGTVISDFLGTDKLKLK